MSDAKKFVSTKEVKNKFSFSLENVHEHDVLDYCLNTWYLPVATEILKNDKAKSVVLSVAQYWNDEASDAVHTHFLPLTGEFESWDACFDPKKNGFISSRDEGYYSNYSGPVKEAEKTVFQSEYGGPYPDNNEIYIRALEHFCKEGSQDFLTQENYNPIMIFHKECR